MSNGQVHRAILTAAAGRLDYGAYAQLLHHFSHHCRRFPLLAKQLHARVVLFSVRPSNFLASQLINFYAKIGHLCHAHHVFDQIPRKNTFAYNALLIAYSLNDRHVDALNLFATLASSYSAGVFPDNYSVTCLLKSLSGSSFADVRCGKEVHGFALRSALDSDVFVLNALITYYAKCDDLALARKVFDKMRERDVVTWNSMIGGYSQGGLYEDCKEMYRRMIEFSGLRPNVFTLASVLQACGQSKDLVLGMDVHRYVVDNHVEIDATVCNSLIGLYAKCGSLDYARELFEEMSEKDEVSYSAMITGYMLHGFVDEGLELFGRMRIRGLIAWNVVISGLVQNNRREEGLDLVREMQSSGVRPNNVTLSSVLPALSYLSNLKSGKELHAYAIKNSHDRNVFVATGIIDVYAKSGFISGARRVFNQSKNGSLIIWTAIISAYAAHGDANSALCLFDEMLGNGIQPDSVTFIAVLTACGHSGLVDKAWEIFDSMFKEYGIQPSVQHYACIVDILSKAGKLSEATDFVRKMPIEPSAKVWGALLNGASVSGDVELGKFVCNHLFEIEPENTGNYVIMANLYSQAGRWKEADKVRERMYTIGLKKIPGSSWVESGEGSQNFIAGDTCGVKTPRRCM